MAGSKIIISNQETIHKNLVGTVTRHLNNDFRKPIADHTRRAFAAAEARLADAPSRPLILDACCGVGDSSRVLAAVFPDHWIIGVDKSESRITRERPKKQSGERPGALPDNLILMRADLNDFYRLAAAAGWRLMRHYILYPNPWPKSVHFKRRWHGSPVFRHMLQLGGVMELRSNWKLYLEEFAAALRVAGHESKIGTFDAAEPITPFERKYRDSGQDLWQLTAELSVSG